jgi:hypothetical protein
VRRMHARPMDGTDTRIEVEAPAWELGLLPFIVIGILALVCVLAPR